MPRGTKYKSRFKGAIASIEIRPVVFKRGIDFLSNPRCRSSIVLADADRRGRGERGAVVAVVVGVQKDHLYP